MSSYLSTLIFTFCLIIVSSVSSPSAFGSPGFEPVEVDEVLEAFDLYFQERSLIAESQKEQSDPFDPVRRDPFDPISRDPFGSIGGGMSIPRYGASFIVAMEVLYQTLNFYGVEHTMTRKGNTIEFKVIHSAKGNFQYVDNTSVAFALHEFSRYLNAHMCNQPTIENFYKVFAQVPPEEIGLRFKYDMAWALLGNYLPRQPNASFTIGSKWAALGKILDSSSTFRGQVENDKELTHWSNLMADLLGIVQELNRMMCYIDIRPRPIHEIKKRIALDNVIGLERKLASNYERYSQIVDLAEEEGTRQKLERMGL